jgi:hypothetical protein
MKYVKMLGLAAIAAAALMAFVGASSASATVLCKVAGTGSPTGTTCPAGEALGVGAEIHAVLESGTSATLTGEPGTEKVIVCNESTVKGEVTAEGSATATAKGNITALTFGKCTSPSLGGTACTVTTLKGGTLEAHWISGTHNGTLTSNGAEVTTSCNSIFGAIHCIFTTNSSTIGTLNGSATTGKTATFEAFEVPLTQVATNALCPSEAGWDGKYEVTTPDTLNVAGHT